MTVARRRDIDRLQAEIEELFSELWQVPRYTGLRRGFRPQVDCFRTEDPPELTVVVELAGVEPETVEIVAAGRTLAIVGERRRPRVAGQVYQQMEIEYGPFACQVPLAEDVDPAAAQATYGRGLLTIVLPVVVEPPRPVRVPIEVRARP